MTLSRTAAFVMILFLGCESAPAGPGEWLVRFDGYGPVRIGMTPAEASRALGMKFESEVDLNDPVLARSCFYVWSPSLKDVGFMVTEGRISRVDIDSDTVLTEAGVKINSTIENIIRLYPGRVIIEPHAYTGPEGSI